MAEFDPELLQMIRHQHCEIGNIGRFGVAQRPTNLVGAGVTIPVVPADGPLRLSRSSQLCPPCRERRVADEFIQQITGLGGVRRGEPVDQSPHQPATAP